MRRRATLALSRKRAAGLTVAADISDMTIRRWIWILVVVAALGGAVAARVRFAPRGPLRPVDQESIDGLVDDLNGDASRAADAQYELELRTKKSGDLDPWKRALDS